MSAVYVRLLLSLVANECQQHYRYHCFQFPKTPARMANSPLHLASQQLMLEGSALTLLPPNFRKMDCLQICTYTQTKAETIGIHRSHTVMY